MATRDRSLWSEANKLERQVKAIKKKQDTLTAQFVAFQRDESLDAVVAALKDIAAAIRQGGSGITPEQQAMLDTMKAKLDANDAAVEAARKET